MSPTSLFPLLFLSLPLAAAVPAAPPPAAPAPLSPLEKEAREVLDALLRVDTSHGHETTALTPIAQRFKQAGVPAEIIESSPGRGNLIARIKGTGKRRPLLLLAHVDVVPVEGQKWRTPPFQPTEQDGFLYARGVSDDKSMAAAIVAVALEVARSKTQLSRDLIVALTAGEETGGEAGVRFLVERRRELLDAELALNEGAGTQLSPDGQRVEVVGISAAEKIFQSYRLVVRGKGGHSSTPWPGADPVTQLARALVRLGEFKFPAHAVPAVKGYLELHAEAERPPLADALRRVAASAPTVRPEDEQLLAQDRVYAAMIRTTCVATMLQASPQDNVLPTSAEAVVNCRVLPDETLQATQAALVKAIADPAVEVTPLAAFGNGGASPLSPEVENAFKSTAAKLWPGAKVSYMMSTGATDSRFLRSVGIKAYGMSCAPGTLDDTRKGFGAHGPAERRLIKWLGPGVQFLRELTLTLAR